MFSFRKRSVSVTVSWSGGGELDLFALPRTQAGKLVRATSSRAASGSGIAYYNNRLTPDGAVEVTPADITGGRRTSAKITPVRFGPAVESVTLVLGSDDVETFGLLGVDDPVVEIRDLKGGVTVRGLNSLATPSSSTMTLLKVSRTGEVELIMTPSDQSVSEYLQEAVLKPAA